MRYGQSGSDSSLTSGASSSTTSDCDQNSDPWVSSVKPKHGGQKDGWGSVTSIVNESKPVVKSSRRNNRVRRVKKVQFRSDVSFIEAMGGSSGSCGAWEQDFPFRPEKPLPTKKKLHEAEKPSRSEMNEPDLPDVPKKCAKAKNKDLPAMPTTKISPTVLSTSQGWVPEPRANPIQIWKGRIYRNCQNGTKVSMRYVTAINGAQRDLIDLHRTVKNTVSFDFTYRATLEELGKQFHGKKLIVCLEVRGCNAEAAGFKEYVEYYHKRMRAGAAVVAKTELLYIMPVEFALRLTVLDAKLIAYIEALKKSLDKKFLIGLWAPSRQQVDK